MRRIRGWSAHYWELKKQLVLFLGLSCMLMLGSLVYVFQYYNQLHLSLLEEVRKDGQEYRHRYEVEYELILAGMSQIATLVAYHEANSRLFEQGAKALKLEGGGKGGQLTEKYRAQLLSYLLPSWERMTEAFKVRQLHFHVSPGDTSFLRVHKPDNYGDDLSNVRHMIVDTLADQRPRQGFEIGRASPGLRSVSPVYSPSDATKFIGVLEAGTSFKTLADILSQLTGSSVSVLLDIERIQETQWSVSDESILESCNCYIESNTSGDRALLERMTAVMFKERPTSSVTRTEVISVDGERYSVTAFGFQDYQGVKLSASKPVGQVLLWRSIEAEYAALQRSTLQIALIVLVGFLIFEVVLYKGLQYVFSQLEREIRKQTRDITELNKRLLSLANHDGLTGLLNRRALMERFDSLYAFSLRYNHPCVVMLVDIDHFKSINDTYGHQAGDEVLREFAKVLTQGRRSVDLVGRYGGEEFIVVLSGTDLMKATEIAESIRHTVEMSKLHPNDTESLTCSIGVADINDASSVKQAIAFADEALYHAKGEGRNSVVTYALDR